MAATPPPAPPLATPPLATPPPAESVTVPPPAPAPPPSEPATATPPVPPYDDAAIFEVSAVGGPVWVAWREGTLTRAAELEALCAWTKSSRPEKSDKVLSTAIQRHLAAARDAARAAKLKPHRKFRIFRNGPLIERATSNLDAVEAHLLNLADTEYVLGQMPCLLKHVQCHLPPNDPRRQEFERIARKLGIKDPDHPLLAKDKGPSRKDKTDTIDEERRKIVSIVRAASSAALREHVRLRSFRNVVVITAILMALLAIGLAITGIFRPTLVPMCFAPEESGIATVVCPTAESEPFIPLGGQPHSGVAIRDIDDVVKDTVNPADLIVVELVGLTAAAIATAAAIRGIRGSSERYGLPVSLAALKLPTGAITAFLGLLLMRGQFVPGLSALDTSAQILAWALVFGYAQQLFTRLIDQQGQTVLNDVRGADRPKASPSPV
ncbi:hypothetical protein P3H15_42275 [Rhodococcus sp. T2V]|uniref:hypothetical protein n=1 Tax=Rhodococcus sp. T2V TaxID=3034164 RepID=UPI0023E2E1A8|nr:hypothetical protein [Rhodococcus sp. T2V]MDF3311609.1 hypothetical protein [Rhodococcus sp. T2V]